MPNKTVAVFHPGEMGAAVGACLVGRGCRVVFASQGRSAATRMRAKDAGLDDVGTMERALAAAEVVLSICPPHGALALARAVAERAFRGVYLDANAISPATAREVGAAVEAGGARFVDGGIIGPPPTPNGSSRLYLSGTGAAEAASLFAGSALEARPLDGPTAAASALKMCYAAWTKGSVALLAGIRALAQHEAVDAALLEEWRHSQAELPGRSQAVSANAYKAWRWVGEMEEIASSFAAAGLPDGFHLAAAELYRRLEECKDAKAPPPLEEISAALLGRKR